MIKKFGSYLLESSYADAVAEEGTFGRWVEKKVSNDDYLKSIISPFLVSFDPDIRIANAVEFLSDFDKKQIFKMLTSKSTRLTESIQGMVAGKGVFVSFLKVITALDVGQPKKVPHKDYLIFYETNEVNDDLVIGLFGRFQSLKQIYSREVENQSVKLYYGLNANLDFVYGVSLVSGLFIMGTFKVTQSILTYLLGLSSPSFALCKMDLSSLNIEDLKLMKKIFFFMKGYPLGDAQKFEPIFSSGVLTFSYFGVSKWDNGVIDSMEYDNIKTNLKTRLSSESWSSRILLNVSAKDSFWLKINYKLK